MFVQLYKLIQIENMEKETKIISFYTQKGGSGKTTLTHMVAIALVSKEMGKTVLVLDADPQQSLVKGLEAIRHSEGNQELMPPYVLEYCPITKMQEVLNEKWGKYDYIFIDLPGTMDMEGVRTSLLACDVVFVPIQPSQLDITSAQDTIQKLEDIKQYKKGKEGFLNYYCLINQAEQKKVSTKELIAYLSSSGVQYLENPMYRYEKYKYLLNSYENILENKASKWGNEEHAFIKIVDEIKIKLSEN